MVSDPAGYVVLFVDQRRLQLSLEYRADGVLDAILEGMSAAELYTPAVAQGLVSRLDHAAYLGRALARAEFALRAGTRYVQDGAREQGAATATAPSCGCGPSSALDSPSGDCTQALDRSAGGSGAADPRE